MHPDHCHRFRFAIPLLVLAFVAALTAVVYYLWNGVLVDVTGVKPVTYWQALGLLVLAKILFGGFPRGRRGWGGRRRARMLAKRWDSLDPEQRERLRETMRRRFGDWPRPPWCEPEGDSKPKEHPPT